MVDRGVRRKRRASNKTITTSKLNRPTRNMLAAIGQDTRSLEGRSSRLASLQWSDAKRDTSGTRVSEGPKRPKRPTGGLEDEEASTEAEA